MPDAMIRGREPRGERRLPRAVREPEAIAPHLEDAAHYRGGASDCLYAPASEAEIAAVLDDERRVLPIGAQSSLTGGATPFGETLLSTARLTAIGGVIGDRVTVGAGVALSALETSLANAGYWYPPVPTFNGATAGGVVATNAAGAATFKHGATRAWVEALTVVLASGDVLDIERGACRADPSGALSIDLPSGLVRVPVPRYRMPEVAKLSAGYFARPGMDLIDLFIGAEGTLGVITAVTFRVVPARPSTCLVFVAFDSQADAYACAGRARDAARESWASAGQHGIDVSAIEHMDARCLALLREAGIDRRESVPLPETACTALLLAVDLDPEATEASVYAEIGDWSAQTPPRTSIGRLCTLLHDYGVLARAEVAPPGDGPRATQLLRVREAVPMLVNDRVRRAAVQIHPHIEKIAADVAVPFAALLDFEAFVADTFRQRGLDGAVWGHISDGNLHPNVIARSAAEIERGRDAMLAIGREAIRRDGTPLAEHGVGRNPVKQRLLLELYGEEAIDDMRRVKQALDPDGKLSPGVIFSTPT